MRGWRLNLWSKGPLSGSASQCRSGDDGLQRPICSPEHAHQNGTGPEYRTPLDKVQSLACPPGRSGIGALCLESNGRPAEYKTAALPTAPTEPWGGNRGSNSNLGIHSATCRPLHHIHHRNMEGQLRLTAYLTPQSKSVLEKRLRVERRYSVLQTDAFTGWLALQFGRG